MLPKEVIFLYRSWKLLTFGNTQDNLEWLTNFCNLYANYRAPKVTVNKLTGLYINSNFKSILELSERIDSLTKEIKTKGVIDTRVTLNHYVVKATDWVMLGELSSEECNAIIDRLIGGYTKLIVALKETDAETTSESNNYKWCNYRAIIPLTGEAREILNITLSLGDIKYARLIKAKTRGNTKG